MKTRFTPILLILFIIAAAILSRFIGGSDYLLAQSSGIYGYAYKFFYCPYNKTPYTDPTPHTDPYTRPNYSFSLSLCISFAQAVSLSMHHPGHRFSLTG